MRLKIIGAAFLSLVIFGIADCRADTPAVSTWSVLWFPWSDTYSSWNWKEAGFPIAIQRANLAKYPDEVKTWEFAVCSIIDPAKKVLVSMANPSSTDSQGNYSMSLEDWTPGAFPVNQLDALGEGTFLCAILGDGHRFSNVSRVTIDHSYHPDTKPSIRILAVPAPEGDIRGIALWVVPSPSQIICPLDLYRPLVSIDGVWRESDGPSVFQGINAPIPPGTGRGEFIVLDSYNPPIKPFKRAQVQVKIIENSMKPYETLPPMPLGKNGAQWIIKYIDLVKDYTSNVVTLSINEADPKQFDQAFGIK